MFIQTGCSPFPGCNGEPTCSLVAVKVKHIANGAISNGWREDWDVVTSAMASQQETSIHHIYFWWIFRRNKPRNLSVPCGIIQAPAWGFFKEKIESTNNKEITISGQKPTPTRPFGSQRYDRPNSTLTRGCWSPGVFQTVGSRTVGRFAARQVSKSSRSILLWEILRIQNVRIFKQMGGNLSDYTVNSSHLWTRTKNLFWVQKKKQRISPLRISEHQSWRNPIDSWYFKGRPSFLQSPLNELAFPKKHGYFGSIHQYFCQANKKPSPIDLSKTMNHLRWCPNHAILLLSQISNMSRACSMDGSLPICHPPGKTTTVSSFDQKKTMASIQASSPLLQ